MDEKKDKDNYEKSLGKGGFLDSKIIFWKIYFRRKYTLKLKIWKYVSLKPHIP